MPHAVMMCFVETRCFIVVLVFGFSSFSDLESSTDSKSLSIAQQLEVVTLF
jgi:hypothetical protein